MSLTLRKRRVVIEVPDTWMGRMKTQVTRASDRLVPMADQAKEVAAHRIEDARYWAAPRLEGAAHRVEDQLAPKVSAMLAQAAGRIDPTPAKSRSWPMIVLVSGLALGAVGYVFYRRNTQQWTDHMKDSASDASQWVSDRSSEAADKVSATADKVASSVDKATDKAASSADRTADKIAGKADEASRKMS